MYLSNIPEKYRNLMFGSDADLESLQPFTWERNKIAFLPCRAENVVCRKHLLGSENIGTCSDAELGMEGPVLHPCAHINAFLGGKSREI